MRRAAAGAMLLALALVACGGDGDAGSRRDGGPATESTTTTMSGAPGTSGGNAVAITGFLFKPESLRVAIGSTVTWTNNDEILHTVTAGTPEKPDRASFDGKLDDKGTTFAHTFDRAGTFAYFCDRHPGAMRATIEVA